MHIQARAGRHFSDVAQLDQAAQLVLVDRDAVTLQFAHQPAAGAVALQRADQRVDVGAVAGAGVAHQYRGGVLVVDQPEGVGGIPEPQWQSQGFRINLQPEHASDALGVQRRCVVVQPLEIALEQWQSERLVRVVVPDLLAGVAGLAEQARRGGGGRHKDVDLPVLRHSALAIAAACCLRDGVQARHGAVDHGKVQVHAGLDQLRADDAHGQRGVAFSQCGAAIHQARFDRRDHVAAVLGAHQGRQVPATVRAALLHQAVQLAGIGAAADDGQHRIVLRDFVGQFGPGAGLLEVGRQMHLHTVQRGVQLRHVVDDFGDAAGRKAAPQALARVSTDAGVQHRLGGGTQQQRHAVVLYQQAQHVHDGLQKLDRQQLCLVQHDHAVGQVVQLAATRGLAGEQTFEELDVGGDDQRRVPVLAGQPRRGGFALGLALGVAVVLDHRAVAQCGEDLAKYFGGLLDDAGVGNGVDHPAFAMGVGMVKCKGQAGEGFAAARGHGQAEDAAGSAGLGLALGENRSPQMVDWCRRRVRRQTDQVLVQG